MKTINLILLSLTMMVCTTNAQIKEDIQGCKKRAENLQALLNDYKKSGNANVDSYGESIKAAALFAIANSEQLENMYKRQIGETVDGVTDVTITKPSLEDWTKLAVTIGGEAASIKQATDKLKSASDEVKTMGENSAKEKNPMKVAKSAKGMKAAKAILEFGNKATPILLEESAAQVKAVNEIIETLKSGKNL